MPVRVGGTVANVKRGSPVRPIYSVPKSTYASPPELPAEEEEVKRSPSPPVSPALSRREASEVILAEKRRVELQIFRSKT